MTPPHTAEEPQPAIIRECTQTAVLMTAAQALGNTQAVLSYGAHVKERHQAVGLYLLARSWASALDFSAPEQLCDETGSPDVATICAQDAEAHATLTFHISQGVYEAPTGAELAAPGFRERVRLGALDATHFTHLLRTDRPRPTPRTVTLFSALVPDPARLGAALAALCAATAQLFARAELDRFLSTLPQVR